MTSYSWLKGRLPTCIMLVVCLAFIPGSVFGADVDVYAEGAYDEDDLTMYIYADINVGPILSFGVKVNYPNGLIFDTATKNDEVWYFGDGVAEYPYMEPEDDGSGSMIIIGGKLDTSAPTAGVTGSRVLLGTVIFTHSGVTDFSGVSLDLGRGGDYANFVDTSGNVKDGAGVEFDVIIAEKGDANADGNINSIDAQYVSSIFFGSAPWTVLADCNGDGSVNSIDAQCISQKFFNP